MQHHPSCCRVGLMPQCTGDGVDIAAIPGKRRTDAGLASLVCSLLGLLFDYPRYSCVNLQHLMLTDRSTGAGASTWTAAWIPHIGKLHLPPFSQGASTTSHQLLGTACGESVRWVSGYAVRLLDGTEGPSKPYKAACLVHEVGAA